MKEEFGMAAIDDLDGVDLSEARRFRRSGVRTTDALLRRAATARGRRDLAAEASVAEPRILELALRSDLMKVKGVGSRYSGLLNQAGVFTAGDLAGRDPETLLALISQINGRRPVVRRLPAPAEVAGWVAAARAARAAVER